MVVPSYQDGKTDEYFNMNVEEEPDTVDTRKAGELTLENIARSQVFTIQPLISFSKKELTTIL